MIEVRGLTKQYGPVTAVDDLTFSVKPGVVTGFLGPNGAGKSTTMRMILGLDRPTSGEALIGGSSYKKLRKPLETVGALLDAKAVHPNRSAYNHLKWVAQTNGIPTSRVKEVLTMVGLQDVARKKVGGFSLGMGQRLGLATAMLGDPEVLLLDEPVNGLDPEGIRWVRTFLQALAAEGRTVLVSSHLLSEMALMADDLIVIGRGKLIAATSTAEFTQMAAGSLTRVRTDNIEEMSAALDSEGVEYSLGQDARGRDSILITGNDTDFIGKLAYTYGIPLSELTEQETSLEDAFMALTSDSVEYRAPGTTETSTQPAADKGDA
ncbi:ABC transporter ATP-binding protein [Corynebacterium aquilae]|uniref:ABC transporter ATP-binding protein n=1 Tax=Corynebacterium aquilae DSM 44791 TaxID=1431546 RepID=A0A1L7CI39_9CORY|nr:ABC transporter ATP-binding protein [Corynebacterium aquilae]APT85526.1 ABC transporter ATP-binding protein [Corynebacterium aquilae DSM 44791]